MLFEKELECDVKFPLGGLQAPCSRQCGGKKQTVPPTTRGEFSKELLSLCKHYVLGEKKAFYHVLTKNDIIKRPLEAL